MMSDVTEEQNLSETGIQKSRIKKDEIPSVSNIRECVQIMAAALTDL